MVLFKNPMGSTLQDIAAAAQRLAQAGTSRAEPVDGKGDPLTEVRDFVRQVYALRTDGWSDEHLQRLEDAVALAIGILEKQLHIAGATELRDALVTAAEGIASGLASDPARRLSRDDLAAEFASDLRKEFGF